MYNKDDGYSTWKPTATIRLKGHLLDHMHQVFHSVESSYFAWLHRRNQIWTSLEHEIFFESLSSLFCQFQTQILPQHITSTMNSFLDLTAELLHWTWPILSSFFFSLFSNLNTVHLWSLWRLIAGTLTLLLPLLGIVAICWCQWNHPDCKNQTRASALAALKNNHMTLTPPDHMLPCLLCPRWHIASTMECFLCSTFLALMMDPFFVEHLVFRPANENWPRFSSKISFFVRRTKNHLTFRRDKVR